MLDRCAKYLPLGKACTHGKNEGVTMLESYTEYLPNENACIHGKTVNGRREIEKMTSIIPHVRGNVVMSYSEKTCSCNINNTWDIWCIIMMSLDFICL